MKNIRTPTVVGLIKTEIEANKELPDISSADAGKLATVDSNGKWTAANLTVGQGEVAVDSTLLVSGAAADAQVTGDKVNELKSALGDTPMGTTATTVTGAIKEHQDEIEDIEDELYYTKEPVLEWVTGLCNVGNFTTKSGDKVSRPFTLYRGETVSIKTKGDGAYLFRTISKVPSLNITIASGYSGGTKIAAITVNTLKEYTYTAVDNEEYISLGGLDDPTTVVTFSNLKRNSAIEDMENELEDIPKRDYGILKNKSVMFFGDSLTSASGIGIVGFPRLMAEEYDMPYARFILDSADNNPDDVPINYPRFTNYGKDGTCNRIITGRTDSVVERVKRHITADTLIDYVLIECCVNDMANENISKGEISDSYTAEFDTTTTIGAIEETLRYLITLGKPIRVGGFIPWQIVWQTDSWFDDYAAVFEKWGVPLFDMRKTAGFDMKHCSASRPIYSLSSDEYAAYDNTVTYDLDDKVKYGGTLYKCLANDVTGIPPTNTTYWMEVSSESSDGTHLNNTGHIVVAGKIQKFLERC